MNNLQIGDIIDYNSCIIDFENDIENCEEISQKLLVLDIVSFTDVCKKCCLQNGFKKLIHKKHDFVCCCFIEDKELFLYTTVDMIEKNDNSFCINGEAITTVDDNIYVTDSTDIRSCTCF